MLGSGFTFYIAKLLNIKASCSNQAGEPINKEKVLWHSAGRSDSAEFTVWSGLTLFVSNQTWNTGKK